MITRIIKPQNLRKNSQYPQYQELPDTLTLTDRRAFNATKRIKGIPPSVILTKQTRMRAEADPDVNNGNVPYHQVWVTGNAPALQAVRLEITEGIGVNLSPGQVHQQDFNVGVGANDILSDVKKGIRQNGNEIYAISGLHVMWTIPQAGIVRIRLQNNSGSNINLGGTTFWMRVFKSVNEIAENFYNFGARRGTTVFAELAENGIPGHYVEQIFQRLFQLMQERDGVTDVNDTSIFADYYDGLYGYSTAKGFIASGETAASLRSYLASESAARGDSGYYRNGAYNYRHVMIPGYIDGIRIMFKGCIIYNMIYNIEKAFVAMNNRKVGVFGWGALEGVDGYIESRAIKQRLRFKNPNGHLIRTVRGAGSFKLIEAQAGFAVLLGHEYTMWNDPAQYGRNLQCFGLSHIGGPDPGKDFWQPLGGNIVQYVPGNQSMPQPVCDQNDGHFSDANAPFYNGAFSGIKKVSQILGRINKSLRYATFSFIENGVAKSGYFNGNSPVPGVKGTGEVSHFGTSNPGQHTIVDQYFNGQLPILMEGTGTEGDCLILCHPGAATLGTKRYIVTTQNHGVQTFDFVGNSFEVFLIS